MTATLERDDVLDLFETVANDVEMYGLGDDEIMIDCFAGGGGVSKGMEMATGRSPDEAINHSAPALAIHAANHPTTRHWHSDVWEVDPLEVAAGRRVGILWLSPDCTHFSRAKGGKPVSKKIRILAHVAIRYANAVRPRIIILENVEEFLGWGPISRATGKPDPKRKGHSFRGFVRQLRRLGYAVDWRMLRGCDYGSPTTRKRLFLVARCDGQPIRWPQPTHGKGRAQPVRVAAGIIDWSLACPSIFLTKEQAKALGYKVQRPLAEKTLRRIARGVRRYVIEAADPFIIPVTHQGDVRTHSLHDPLPTITAANRGEHALVAPTLIQTGYGEDMKRNGGAGQAPRALDLEKPLGTVVAGGSKHALVSSFLAKHYGGNETPGSDARDPLDTITATDHHAHVAVHIAKHYGDRVGSAASEPLHTVTAASVHHALVTSHLQRDFGKSVGSGADEPVPTITAGGGGHVAEVRAFLTAYYNGNPREAGSSLRDPARTVTATDRLGLVTVHGTEYVIVDIGMRMLTPRELARAQGFPDSYVLDVVVPSVIKRGKRKGQLRLVTKGARKGLPKLVKISKSAQTEMVGNSVNPQVACALIVANVGRPAARERAA